MAVVALAEKVKSLVFHVITAKCWNCKLVIKILTTQIDFWKSRIVGLKINAYCPECGKIGLLKVGISEYKGEINNNL